ncbi:MAG: OprO/OprP family phosphate-selective porin [Acidobacteria bacterium]|nr:OprO/OprP family phosphate-selective porin [Acidobacteriota bacterium]MCI0625320.1 OprO/OprP family phosphate-selective porin [Acidobacteriota bacterium]MCI0723414.1 OprO/OprP family phosphate-selective porin [Acidobacteriota bacterium]
MTPAKARQPKRLRLFRAPVVRLLQGFALLCLELLPSLSPGQSLNEEYEKGSDKEGIHLVMKRYPSLRFGNVLRVDFRARFQADSRNFSPALIDIPPFELRQARVGIQGVFLKRLEYEVEGELRDAERPWRDVYMNYRGSRKLQIQAGRFKVPFGLDQLTRITDQDYLFRSRAGDLLTPGRDVGLMAHGRFFKQALTYQAGIFRSDGDNAGTGERTAAVRLTGTPFLWLPVPRLLKNLTVGVAATHSGLPEGLNSLRGRTLSRYTFFDRVFVSGRRVRLGTEMDWSRGPFSMRGEFIQSEDTRQNQGVRSQDLPNLLGRGWYLSGTWMVTGEKKARGPKPRREFLHEGGWGALELAGRYEQLRFGSRAHSGPAAIHARAANILGNSERVWTFGVNWYLNRHAKIQVNAVHEEIEDRRRSPLARQEHFWGQFVRLQLAF